MQFLYQPDTQGHELERVESPNIDRVFAPFLERLDIYNVHKVSALFFQEVLLFLQGSSVYVEYVASLFRLLGLQIVWPALHSDHYFLMVVYVKNVRGASKKKTVTSFRYMDSLRADNKTVHARMSAAVSYHLLAQE